MAKRKVDLYELVTDSWQARMILTSAQRIENFATLLSRSYIIMKNWYDYKCLKENIPNEDLIFNIFKKIIIKFIFCDREFHNEEYAMYCSFVSYCKAYPESIAECKKIYKETSLNYISGCIKYILPFREIIPPDYWRQMLLGFCYLCTADDVMHENQFILLQTFFEKGFDEKPESWDEYVKRRIVRQWSA